MNSSPVLEILGPNSQSSRVADLWLDLHTVVVGPSVRRDTGGPVGLPIQVNYLGNDCVRLIWFSDISEGSCGFINPRDICFCGHLSLRYSFARPLSSIVIFSRDDFRHELDRKNRSSSITRMVALQISEPDPDDRALFNQRIECHPPITSLFTRVPRQVPSQRINTQTGCNPLTPHSTSPTTINNDKNQRTTKQQ